MDLDLRFSERMKEKGSDRSASPDVLRMVEKAKQELEHMIDLNPQVMLLLDPAGHILRANKAALHFLGIRSFRDVLNRNIRDIIHIDDAKSMEPLLTCDGECHSTELQAALADGKKHILQLTTIVSGRNSDLIVLIVADVTRDKLRATRMEKEHKREAVQAVAGALMHRVNQPLTVIMIRAQLMQVAIQKETLDPAELKQSIDDITTYTMKIANILKGIERSKDYFTEPYMEGVEILDIDRSCGADEDPVLSRTPMLDMLILALDAHDPGAARHARHCGRYAELLARKMGFSEKEVQIAFRSAVCHDIGKIGIPDTILKKPGLLSEKDMDIVRKHPRMGHSLLTNFPFLEEEAKAAFMHHERHDGKGYPRGLNGAEIPRITMIVSVVDAFEAMIFGRPYKPARSLEDTVREIREGSGTQFTPEVVEAFLLCCKDLYALFEKELAQ